MEDSRENFRELQTHFLQFIDSAAKLILALIDHKDEDVQNDVKQHIEMLSRASSLDAINQFSQSILRMRMSKTM